MYGYQWSIKHLLPHATSGTERAPATIEQLKAHHQLNMCQLYLYVVSESTDHRICANEGTQVVDFALAIGFFLMP